MRKILPLLPLLVTPAFAQQEPPIPRIVVSASASVATPPDRAEIGYDVRGEGRTADEATGAMVAKRKAIDAALGSFARAAEARTGDVRIDEVRGRDCNRNSYGNPRLSEGECAIVGYVADLTITLRTGAVRDAGTMVGLIARGGGTDPRIARFFLADTSEAERRATTAALAAARKQAEAVAAATDVALGPLILASDTGQNGVPAGDDIVVSASRRAAPAPPPPPPPVTVDLVPRPIETQARVTTTYAIAR